MRSPGISPTTPTRTWTGRVFIATSLDGFIARPDGDIGWLTDPPQRPHAHVDSSRPAQTWDTFFPAVDHLVMGRGTYDKVASFDEWPYADKRVVVLSTTPRDDDDRVTVVRTLDDALLALDDGHAQQVYVDGGQVIRTFLRAGLIDELTVSRAPVLLGSGLPLFGDLPDEVHLSLQASHASDDGMVHSTYTVERPASDSAAVDAAADGPRP